MIKKEVMNKREDRKPESKYLRLCAQNPKSY
jgi:hypothetical protein